MILMCAVITMIMNTKQENTTARDMGIIAAVTAAIDKNSAGDRGGMECGLFG
jgi:hypothetical protein